MELHDNPHLSDLVAQFIRRTYGPSLPLSDEIGSDGAIHFGRGGPYDEHSNLALLFGDGTNGRECEATLVAKRFGVLDLPELQPLLEHVLPVDTRGEQKGILRLGRIVERFWDIFTESWQFVHWAELIIRASIFYERGITKEGAVDPAFIIGCIEEAWARAKRGFPYPVPPKIIAYLQSLGEDGAAASFDELKLFGLPYCAVILWRYFRLRAEKLNRFGILSVIDPREWLVAWLEDVLLGELVYQQRFFEAQPDADRAIYGDVTCRGKAARIAVVVSDQPRVHSVITERHPEVILTVVRRTSGHIQCFRRRTHQLVRIKDRMQFLAALIRAREQEKRGVPVSSWDELTAVHGPFGAEQWFYDARTGDVYCGTRTQSRVRASRLFNEEFCRFAVTALKDSWDELLKQFIISHGGTVWTPKVPTAEPAATVAE
ncbi:MAG: hypothetical protein HY474_02400 [Candidatus Sungbacteria bacterium]|uniref:Uncharacterized protein n=1 Tax=Candidatus Sungiibacteriota bacterium TaxID=2750080 RepID=A0A932YVY6_9BACT|nr:hypothetical protein [Candidatus Sungbacteria bacterium]